jgi:superfamily II DNA/RNA helicase
VDAGHGGACTRLPSQPRHTHHHKSEFQAANKNIEQHVHICHDIPQKKEKLHEILMSLPPITNSTRTIIFAQERQVVQALYEVLSTQFAKVAALHGDMKQDERLTALRMLRDEPHSVLVGTEVASRGLDIKGLVCVVNFDMPFSIDTYINNIGRTGRAGQKGFAHSFFEPARDGAIVADLVRCMEESGQEPPLDIYRYFRKNKRKAPVPDDPQDPDAPAPEASAAPKTSEEPPVPDTDGNKTSGEKKKTKKRQEPEEEEDRQEPPVVHTGGNTTKAERKKTKKRQEHDEEEDLQEPPAPDTDVDNANATRKKKKKRPDADDE